MGLRLVNPDDLWEDARGNTLWYNNGRNKDLYLIVNLYEIVAFYIIVDDHLIYGEPGAGVRYGKIQNTFDLADSIADLEVDALGKVISAEKLNDARAVATSCEGLDSSLSSALLLYLDGDLNALYLRPQQLQEAEEVLNESKKPVKNMRTSSKVIWLPTLFLLVTFLVYISIFNKYEPIRKYVRKKRDAVPAKKIEEKTIAPRMIVNNQTEDSPKAVGLLENNLESLAKAMLLGEFNEDYKDLLNTEKKVFEKDSEEFKLFHLALAPTDEGDPTAETSLRSLEKLCEEHDVCFPLADYWLKNQNKKAASLYYKRDCQKYGGKVCNLSTCLSKRTPASSNCLEVKNRIK